MPSKKNKNDPSKSEPLKPLGHYVKDRLELTKQLFSCLKSKQIKSRLPTNLQNKSMERIQQMCLDEILGISSKRLLSIINNTKCPLDTESDSDIEHISLSEISSNDSDLEMEPDANDKPKKSADEPPRAKTAEREKSDPPNLRKGTKEMTMLELLELQARARAIRSQLALEPVTKIELDSDEEEAGETSNASKEKTNEVNKAPETSKASTSNEKSVEKQKASANKTDERNGKEGSTTEKSKDSHAEKSKDTSASNDKPSSSKPRRVVLLKSPEKEKSSDKAKNISQTKTKESSKASAPPIKLKRNFSATLVSTASIEKKEPTPPPTQPPSTKEDETNLNASRTSSPDVITMEQNIATYFISDSEEEETEKDSPAKKMASPQNKIIVQSVVILPNTAAHDVAPEKEEEEVAPVEKEAESQEQQSKAKEEDIQSANDDDDENVVNLMSDTEIDININSDKEDNESQESVQKKSLEVSSQDLVKEETEKTEEVEKAKSPPPPEPPTAEPVPQSSQSTEFEDDVVEILHSGDELLDSDKPSDSGKNSDESETWEQRYMRSSNVSSVLKTSKLAKKVREKIVEGKRTLRASKRKDEKEKEIKEKMSKLEEGSMEQFEVLKESKGKE